MTYKITVLAKANEKSQIPIWNKAGLTIELPKYTNVDVVKEKLLFVIFEKEDKDKKK